MLVALVLSGGAQAQTSSGKSTYLDPHQAIQRRVDDLLKRMTLKERWGQFNLPCVYGGATR